jgi:putative MATE family efflux protein
LDKNTELHKTTARLGTDPLGKLIIRLSLPSCISMITASLYNLVNAFWVAKLGYQSVAAVTVVMPFFMFCMAISVGTGIGVNALASRRFGERNVEGANQAVGQTFFLSLVIGLFFLIITNVLPWLILRICGATPDIMEIGSQYISVFGWSIPLYLFSIMCRNIFAASGDTLRPMIFAITGQVINALLDPFLIFGWGFFPQMGVRGAALATCISIGISAFLPLWFIFNNKTAYNIHFNHCLPRIGVMKDIYRVGFPAMLMETTESIAFALFNNIAAGFGSVVLAALGITLRITDLVFMPVLGTAQGLLPIVGFSLGARMWDRLWGAVKLTASRLGMILVVFCVLLEIFTPQVLQLFKPDPQMLAIAITGMRILFITLPLMGVTIIFITTFQGLSKGRDAMVLSLTRQFIFFVPGLFLFTHLWGLNGFWISLPVSDFLGTVVATLWLIREYRIQKKSEIWLISIPVQSDHN